MTTIETRKMDALRSTINTQGIKTKQIVFQYPDGSFPEAGAILNVTDTRGHTDWTRAPNLDSVTLVDASGNEGVVSYTDVSGLLVNNIPVGGGGGGGAVSSVTAGPTNNMVIAPTTGAVIVDLSKNVVLTDGPSTVLLRPSNLGPVSSESRIGMTVDTVAFTANSGLVTNKDGLYIDTTTFAVGPPTNALIDMDTNAGEIRLRVNKDGGSNLLKLTQNSTTSAVTVGDETLPTIPKLVFTADSKEIDFKFDQTRVTAETSGVLEINSSTTPKASVQLNVPLMDYLNTFGTPGQVLKSQGATFPPIWADDVSGGGGGAVNSVNSGPSGNIMVNPIIGDVYVDLSDNVVLTDGTANISLQPNLTQARIDLSANTASTIGAIVLNDGGASGLFMSATNPSAGAGQIYTNMDMDATNSAIRLRINDNAGPPTNKSQLKLEQLAGGVVSKVTIGDPSYTSLSQNLELTAGGKDIVFSFLPGFGSTGVLNVNSVSNAPLQLNVPLNDSTPSPGTLGQVLTSQGAGLPPVWAAGGGGSVSAGTNISVSGSTVSFDPSGGVNMLLNDISGAGSVSISDGTETALLDISGQNLFLSSSTAAGFTIGVPLVDVATGTAGSAGQILTTDGVSPPYWASSGAPVIIASNTYTSLTPASTININNAEFSAIPSTGITNVRIQITIQGGGGGGGGGLAFGSPSGGGIMSSGGGGGGGAGYSQTLQLDVSYNDILTYTIGSGGNGGAGNQILVSGTFDAAAGASGGTTQVITPIGTYSVVGGGGGGGGSGTGGAQAGGAGSSPGTAGSFSFSGPGASTGDDGFGNVWGGVGGGTYGGDYGTGIGAGPGVEPATATMAGGKNIGGAAAYSGAGGGGGGGGAGSYAQDGGPGAQGYMKIDILSFV